jgi:hypothetical protein
MDNLLVWNNMSFWYKPKDHTTTQVNKVRIYFQECILGFASLHAAFLIASISLIVVLKIKLTNTNTTTTIGPVDVELSWAFFVGVVAVVVDVVYVGLFIFFDQYTFFTVPQGKPFDPIEGV